MASKKKVTNRDDFVFETAPHSAPLETYRVPSLPHGSRLQLSHGASVELEMYLCPSINSIPDWLKAKEEKRVLVYRIPAELTKQERKAVIDEAEEKIKSWPARVPKGDQPLHPFIDRFHGPNIEGMHKVNKQVRIKHKTTGKPHNVIRLCEKAYKFIHNWWRKETEKGNRNVKDNAERLYEMYRQDSRVGTNGWPDYAQTTLVRIAQSSTYKKAMQIKD